MRSDFFGYCASHLQKVLLKDKAHWGNEILRAINEKVLTHGCTKTLMTVNAEAR